MTSFVATAVAALSITASAAAQSPAGSASMPGGFRDEFLAQFNSSMSKFIALAEAMPAEKYAWSPGPGVMTVARVYAHVAHYNYSYPSGSMRVALPAGIRLDTLERAVATKAAVVALLKQSGEYVKQAVQRMPDSQLTAGTTLYGRNVQQWAVLFQLLAHMNEHLGQSIAYARMNGVVPPWSS